MIKGENTEFTDDTEISYKDEFRFLLNKESNLEETYRKMLNILDRGAYKIPEFSKDIDVEIFIKNPDITISLIDHLIKKNDKESVITLARFAEQIDRKTKKNKNAKIVSSHIIKSLFSTDNEKTYEYLGAEKIFYILKKLSLENRNIILDQIIERGDNLSNKIFKKIKSAPKLIYSASKALKKASELVQNLPNSEHKQERASKLQRMQNLADIPTTGAIYKDNTPSLSSIMAQYKASSSRT